METVRISQPSGRHALATTQWMFVRCMVAVAGDAWKLSATLERRLEQGRLGRDASGL